MEYQARRQKLMAQMLPNSVAILFSATEKVRSADTHFPFRQDSNFFYLSGFNEPDAVIVLIPNAKKDEYILFSRAHDAAIERWEGLWAGQDGAIKTYKADKAYPITELDQRLPELLSEKESVYFPIGHDSGNDQRVMEWVGALRSKVRSGIKAPTQFIGINSLLSEMRLRKSQYEIDTMRQAAQISAYAHCKAMQICQPGMMEYELNASLTHDFMQQGCAYTAYDSIVGGGENATYLHYTKNNATLKDGDLVLIDAGGEYQGYASDITRCFPVNGTFSKEQGIVYQAVLDTQLAIIKQVKPGVAWQQLQDIAASEITRHLVNMGLLKGDPKQLFEDREFVPFYMHNFGHWIGLDVHDVGAYKVDGQSRRLEAGMVLTVEPGIYISSDIPGIPKQWHGIGVRIEDDVLVTETGCEVLSKAVPKDMSKIEGLMKNNG